MEGNQGNILMTLRNAFIYKITTSIETSLNMNTIHKRLTSLPSDRPADASGRRGPQLSPDHQAVSAQGALGGTGAVRQFLTPFTALWIVS